jgi:hypothetical protein
MSPLTTLENQTANCFELAILLASFLIGYGYNAFVVQGYATESVCNNDLSKIKLDMSKYDVCIYVYFSILLNCNYNVLN